MSDSILKSEYASRLTLANMEIHRLNVENKRLQTLATNRVLWLPFVFLVGFALVMLLNLLCPLKS